jgi:aspartate dehydrogenase
MQAAVRQVPRRRTLRIARIGCGAIGQEFVRYVRAAGTHVEVVGALVRDVSRHCAADCPIVSAFADLLVLQPDLFVECASQSALAAFAPRVLGAGHDLVAVSVGALADRPTQAAIQSAAQEGNAQLCIPAGALAGIDALAAARQIGISGVRYVRHAPAATWIRAGAITAAEGAALTECGIIFEGSARDAAIKFPKSANVAATIALAGIGFDATRVRLIADPAGTENVHAIEADGAFGRLNATMAAAPIAGARSSRVVAGSLAHAVLSRTARIAI